LIIIIYDNNTSLTLPTIGNIVKGDLVGAFAFSDLFSKIKIGEYAETRGETHPFNICRQLETSLKGVWCVRWVCAILVVFVHVLSDLFSTIKPRT